MKKVMILLLIFIPSLLAARPAAGFSLAAGINESIYLTEGEINPYRHSASTSLRGFLIDGSAVRSGLFTGFSYSTDTNISYSTFYPSYWQLELGIMTVSNLTDSLQIELDAGIGCGQYSDINRTFISSIIVSAGMHLAVHENMSLFARADILYSKSDFTARMLLGFSAFTSKGGHDS